MSKSRLRLRYISIVVLISLVCLIVIVGILTKLPFVPSRGVWLTLPELLMTRDHLVKSGPTPENITLDAVASGNGYGNCQKTHKTDEVYYVRHAGFTNYYDKTGKLLGRKHFAKGETGANWSDVSDPQIIYWDSSKYQCMYVP